MGLHNEEQQKTHKSKVKYPTQTIWDDKAREKMKTSSKCILLH